MKEKEKEKKMAGIIEELNHIANEVQVKIENTKPLAGEKFRVFIRSHFFKIPHFLKDT